MAGRQSLTGWHTVAVRQTRFGALETQVSALWFLTVIQSSNETQNPLKNLSWKQDRAGLPRKQYREKQEISAWWPYLVAMATDSVGLIAFMETQ